MGEKLNVYDFEVFKALVEIEIKRSKRYHTSRRFSIAFLYAPHLAKDFQSIGEKPPEIDIAFMIKDDIRSSDIISPVEEDFIFLFFPETSKDQAKKSIERVKSKFKFEIIEGIATFPEDGKTPYDLFTKLVHIMNEKLIPVIEIGLE